MRAVCAILLALMIGISEGEAGEVAATGVAPILENNLVAARTAALEAAKRSAVEQALGSYIESRTQVSEFALASDKIYSSVKGRIDKYRITFDAAQADELYRVEIVATFEDDVLLSETEKLLKKHHWHKKPRLLIDIQGEDNATGKQLASHLQQGLEKKFRQHGFDVFVNVGRQQQPAGFLLQGNALVSVQESDYQGVTLNSSELFVTASLQRIGSGQVISSSSYTGSKPGANQARILKTLNREAVKKLYADISRQMNDEWLQYQSRGSDIQLELSGSELSRKVVTIKSDLSSMLRGVRSISIDSVQESNAVLSVVYLGWPEQLLDELSLAIAKNKKAGVAVDGMSGNTLQLRIL